MFNIICVSPGAAALVPAPSDLSKSVRRKIMKRFSCNAAGCLALAVGAQGFVGSGFLPGMDGLRCAESAVSSSSSSVSSRCSAQHREGVSMTAAGGDSRRSAGAKHEANKIFGCRATRCLPRRRTDWGWTLVYRCQAHHCSCKRTFP